MSEERPLVGVICGSNSDAYIMTEALKVLSQYEVPYKMEVVSAHRTPEKMFEYAKTAKERGLKVIIAGAGGAAHLPGMVASFTSLPVIGVPIRTDKLSGLDSLLSICQMPAGVPVATMALDGAWNAGLLAVRILALSDSTLAERLIAYKDEK